MNEMKKDNGNRSWNLGPGEGVWKEDISNEEIKKILEKIGTDFENIKNKLNNYYPTSRPITPEKFLENIKQSDQGNAAEMEFLLKQKIVLIEQFNKLESEKDEIEEKMYTLSDSPEKETLKKQFDKKNSEIRALLEKNIIDERIIESN